jgi:polyribonucleotide nucleotidyltransferase
MPNGDQITIETGKLAKQADGSVVVRQGNCMILATVCSTKDAKEDLDFLPLSVDYQEKFAANGRIPGSFLRREGRLSDYEVLICRLVDRALRPLFPDDYHADTQVMLTLISADENVMPDALAAFAASAAIAVSDIPFNGPISEVRIARIDGVFVVNPSIKALETADLDLMLAATLTDILMVEGEANECSETDLVEAIRLGHEAIKIQIAAQQQLAAQLGVTKRTYSHEKSDETLLADMTAACYEPCKAIARAASAKKVRSEAFAAVLADFLATKTEEETATFSKFLIKKYFHDIEKKAMRAVILEEGVRLDGRKTDQVRPIWCEADYLPTPHGSALFTRGETQSLTTVTLGSKLDQQLIDGAMFEGDNRLMLHYNFPGYSTGEVRPNRGVGRREVGHGNLALRALKKVLPNQFENPYTLRIVSDILESNGSSSMATVCAGSLALMDAGIKTKGGVSGIAMGLITDGGKYAVLSDILGDEDHLGDMDFKVAGTQNGITAVQMDIKIDGLPYEVLTKALEQAKAGRLHILGIMNETLNQHREDYKPNAPRIIKIEIERDEIGAIIGTGGKVIQEMQRETNTTISVEEVGNKGIVEIFSADKAGLDAALKRINDIVAKPEIGATYEGKVKTMMAFGAFIEYMPGKDALLHVSEMSWQRVENPEDVVKEGDIVTVKLVGIDPKTGKMRLSMKELQPKPEGYVERPPREPRPDGDRFGGDRRGGGGGFNRGGDRPPRNER